MLTSSSTIKARKAPQKRGASAILGKAVKASGRQRPPTHPGAVVKSALEFLGGSIRKHSEAMGLSHTGLGKIAASETAMEAETALRIARYFDLGETGAEMLLGLQTDYDLFHARAALRGELASIKPAQRPPQP